jgi:hypothetical protein
MHQIRPAVAADAPRICELIYAQPGSEAVTLLGAVDTARRFGERVMQAQPSLGWKSTDVTEVDSEVVGVLQHGPRSDDPPVDEGIGALSLSVRSDNPARHFYHRAGYRVVASRTNRGYERLTGARGRS